MSTIRRFFLSPTASSCFRSRRVSRSKPAISFCRVGVLPVEVDPVVIALVDDRHHRFHIAVFRFRLGHDGTQIDDPIPSRPGTGSP